MTRFDSSEAHRFVVVYRQEPREIDGAVSSWRGLLVAVPNAPGADEEKRLAFSDLNQLPELIRSLIHGGNDGEHPRTVDEEPVR